MENENTEKEEIMDFPVQDTFSEDDLYVGTDVGEGEEHVSDEN